MPSAQGTFTGMLNRLRLHPVPSLLPGSGTVGAVVLGACLAPYLEADAPRSIPVPSVPLREIGVDRGQYDLWWQIISAALAGHPDQPHLDFHPALPD
jgi:hypothetical protein